MGEITDLRITPVTIQAQTASKLRDAIVDGLFKPGEKLLEAELCRQMGVSRTSVREALRQLEAERLVKIIPNRGPSVTQLTWKRGSGHLRCARTCSKAKSAARFAERATAPEIAQAKAALADFDRAVTMDDARGRLTYTQRFYDLIIQGCGNAIIGEMLQSLFARINFPACALNVAQKGAERTARSRCGASSPPSSSTMAAPRVSRQSSTSSRPAQRPRRSLPKTSARQCSRGRSPSPQERVAGAATR